jgi:CDP-diacylglycerol--serine O-phosphatidyltransferase
VAAFDKATVGADPIANYLYEHHFIAAAYLIFLAMIFDAIDGRLARFARHTTDFGGQLDSLADVISFGAAPAFLALMVFKSEFTGEIPFGVSRLIWAISALYMSCAALRLARFNVSNEHGEQHHFSFLGLPSPGAGGTVAAYILMQQDFVHDSHHWIRQLGYGCVYILPIVVLCSGLLMISQIRYPHLVNRYLRGKRSMGRLMLVLILALMLVVNHRFTLGVCMMVYSCWSFGLWVYSRSSRGKAKAAALPTPPGST